jgi:alpha-N-arabinofuranosidase
VHVRTNLTGTAQGRLLTAPRIDSHNSFDAPETVKPVVFSGRVEAGRIVFDMPAKSIAVVRIE